MPVSPASAAESFRAVGLAELESSAALQDRIDSKYVISLEDFATLAERLLGTHVVLEIDGRRAFHYRTTYFDTRELRIFRDHVQERRRRYKCRAREYVDSGLCLFEVTNLIGGASKCGVAGHDRPIVGEAHPAPLRRALPWSMQDEEQDRALGLDGPIGRRVSDAASCKAASDRRIPRWSTGPATWTIDASSVTIACPKSAGATTARVLGDRPKLAVRERREYLQHCFALRAGRVADRVDRT